jgi:hypothetical protein
LMYRDGVLIFSSTYTISPVAQALGTQIGANPDSGTNRFDGYLDEVSISNYQVSADRLLLHSAARLNDSISRFTIGPTLCGNVRTGTGAFDLAERWCLGNLAGTYGYASSPTSVYGFASGNASATWISADATNGFRIMSGSAVKTQFDASGNGFLTGDLSIGTSGSLRSGATAYDTDTGYWLDFNGGTPRFRIGTTTGAGTPSYLRWTGSALEVKSSALAINSTGIEIAGTTSGAWSGSNAYKFNWGDGRDNGLATWGNTIRQLELRVSKNGGTWLGLVAENTSGGDAEISVQSEGGAGGGSAPRIQLNATDIYVNGSNTFTGVCSGAITVENGLIKTC